MTSKPDQDIRYFIAQLIALKQQFKRLHEMLEQDRILQLEYEFFKQGEVVLDKENNNATPFFMRLYSKYQATFAKYNQLFVDLDSFIKENNLPIDIKATVNVFDNLQPVEINALRYNPATQKIYNQLIKENEAKYNVESKKWISEKNAIESSYNKRHEYDFDTYSSLFICSVFGVGLPFLLIYSALHAIDKIVATLKTQSLDHKINYSLAEHQQQIQQAMKKRKRSDAQSNLSQRFFKCTKHLQLCGFSKARHEPKSEEFTSKVSMKAH